MTMKLREFLAGVDPRKCGAERFCYDDGTPCCPLGHAAVGRGYTPLTPPEGGMCGMFGLASEAVGAFASTWDRYFSFEMALRAGEAAEEEALR